MTRDEHVREKCIEANPEIIKLQNGCLIKGGGIVWNGSLFFNYDEMTDNIDVSEDEIIGREIRLADILLAIERLNRGNKKNDFNKLEYGLNGKQFWIGNSITHDSMDWDLMNDSYDLQSEPTKDFIARLLGYDG